MCVQAHNHVVDQAVTSKMNEDGDVRENFQNLFSSIAKNDPKKSRIYHEILQQEVAKENEVFGVMKEVLQIAQNKNAYKKRNLYKNSNIDESIIAIKREANDGGRPAASQTPKKLEKEFINSGVGTGKNKTWKATRFVNWTLDRQSALCERALDDSLQFEYGRLPVITEKTVEFKAEKHNAIRVTLLKCPTALKKYLYESPREIDCYLIFREEQPSKENRDKKEDNVYIEREVCDVGLM